MFNSRPTTLRAVSLKNPESAIIAAAAAILCRGGLVAFPTETVYGLGANALDSAAVKGIFAAKGRPADNPVIVHVADADAARRITGAWPAHAEKLAANFWPGPLTIVLPKGPNIPDIVTAGGTTVGVRVPAHPVALALLQAAQIPIAAPSANRSTQISPTTAKHVLSGLEGRIDFVLDAGPTSGGLESTVLDLTVSPPKLLRPGLVTVEQLEAVIGPIALQSLASGMTRLNSTGARPEPAKSPGLQERHYAPKAKLICSGGNSRKLIEKLAHQVKKIGWMRFNGMEELPMHGDLLCEIVEMPADAAAYSQRLYAALHELDGANVEYIVVDLPPDGRQWLAVRDRLRRAAAVAAPQESAAD